MKRQKGQSIVEFALVLPFLLGIILSIIFFGLIFSDYLALNSLARTIARDAALYDGRTGYNTYITNTKGYDSSGLPNKLYTWDPSQSGSLTVVNLKEDGSTASSSEDVDRVKVTLKATANQSGGFFGTAASFIKWAFGSDASNRLRTLEVDYTMRKENGRKATSD